MKRTVLAVTFIAISLFLGRPAAAQQLRHIVINGTATPPVIVETDLSAGDRPTIARIAKGVYLLTFRFDIRFFIGAVQRGGVAFDASEMLLTSVFATNNARVVRVFTYGFSAGNPTKTFAEEGRISLLVVR